MGFIAIDEAVAERERPLGFTPLDDADRPRYGFVPLSEVDQSALPIKADAGPTPEELERASRPATGIRTRGGQFLFTEPEPYRDNWDRETQGEQRAPWTGEGGVLESLPAQMVAGTRSAVANLRRMLAEESAAQRRPVVSGPAVAETPAGAVTGLAAPGSIEKQRVRLVANEDEIMAAAQDAARAMGDLRAVTPHGMNTAQQAVSSLAQSAPPTALGIAAGILTKNPALAMAIAGGGGGLIQAGSTYGEARERGASHRLSATAATIDAILEGVGEALPLKVALKANSPIAHRIFGTMAAEAGQEAATQAMQDFNAFLTYNPDITFNEAWHNFKVATLAGFLGGSVYSTAGAAADAGGQSATPIAGSSEASLPSPVQSGFTPLNESSQAGTESPEGFTPIVEVLPRVADANAIVEAAELRPGIWDTVEVALRDSSEYLSADSETRAAVDAAVKASQQDPLAISRLATEQPEAYDLVSRVARDTSRLVGLDIAEIQPRSVEGAVSQEPVSEAHAMMPGAQYTGFIDDGQQAAGQLSAGEPIRREDVLARFVKALNAPIYEGRVQGKRLGYYRPKLETVRIKRASDLETAAHELAHLIDDRVFNGFGTQPGVSKARPWSTGPQAKVFATELRGVSYDATKVYEGWAEFVRLWMTQPTKAKAAAPQFTQWFETFIKQHPYGPAIQQAQQDMLAWFGQDALARARSKIGETESINRHLSGFWDRFRQSTVDDLHGVYRMERDLTGKIMPRGAYETARLTRGAHAIMDGAIRYGHLVRKPDGSFTFEGKGLDDILKPVSSRLDDFLLYAVGRSARELSAQGREHLFTPGEIKAMVELETPEFRKAFLEYQDWNKGILDFAEAHGIINSFARSQWKRAEYLPFHRVGSGEIQKSVGGAEGNWKGIQRLTGGTDNIRDVLGNMIGNAAMLIEVALKNDARARIAQLAQTKQGGGRFMERIPAESRLVKIEREQVRQKLLEAAGVSGRTNPSQAGVVKTIDGLMANAPFLMDFLVKGQTPTGGNIIAVLNDGKPTYYEVIDPILYRAVSALNRPTQSTLLKWLSLPKRIGQASITLTPDFAVANIARDTIMGAVMSRSGFLPVIDSIRGLANRLRGDPAYLEYIANGGGYSSYFVDESAFRSHLQRFYSQRGINPRTVIDSPQKLLYFMETVFDAFELSTRLGEYKRARAQGVHPRVAAYLGREVSTDFAMKGDSRELGFFYDTVMFLRPAVVSMDRLFRGAARDPNRGAIAAKTAGIALMSAVLFLLNRDKEEYEGLEDWDRDSYWHFFIPGPDGKDLHFRYPKIWEVGAIATLAERSVERILDGSPKEYANDFGRVLRQSFNLNFMPQVLAPLYEQAVNEHGFTGRPIEPQGLEDLQPFLRAKPYTSETLRALGMATKDFPEALQVNPVRAEAMLTGYLNTWAMYGLMLSDAALFSGKLPERRLDQYPIVRRFFRENPPLHTKHERTFYEMLDEARRLRGTMRELDRMGQRDDADALESNELSGKAQQLERAQRSLSAIHNDMTATRRSDLSPGDKRRRLDELTAEKNAFMKAAVEDLRRLKERGATHGP